MRGGFRRRRLSIRGGDDFWRTGKWFRRRGLFRRRGRCLEEGYALAFGMTAFRMMRLVDCWVEWRVTPTCDSLLVEW